MSNKEDLTARYVADELGIDYGLMFTELQKMEVINTEYVVNDAAPIYLRDSQVVEVVTTLKPESRQLAILLTQSNMPKADVIKPVI